MNDISIIDAHAVLGREYHLHLDSKVLLSRMDAHGIEIALARPCGAQLAVYNVEGNNLVLNAHKRIRGLVSVNPWYGDKALEELRRCHDLGAVGLFLHPSRQGFMPTDDMVRPILDWAQKSNWPVMFHTGTYIHSDILALGEVARKYPDINFIAGFGGFTDMWFELPGVFAEVPNLFLDASMIWGDAIEEIVRDYGAEKVLFGGALPRNNYVTVLNAIDRLGFSDEQRRQIFSSNARRLFELS